MYCLSFTFDASVHLLDKTAVYQVVNADLYHVQVKR